MTDTTRRSVLTALGLAPTYAVGAETFTDAPTVGSVGRPNKETIIDALRNLAELVESDRVFPSRLGVSSELRSGKDMTHQLIIDFRYFENGVS
jgi:hypothetical protein